MPDMTDLKPQVLKSNMISLYFLVLI